MKIKSIILEWFFINIYIIVFSNNKLSRIEFIHAKNFIHRDIKPDNFVIGLKNFYNALINILIYKGNGENSDLIYVIDYGLAKRYRDPITGSHIPYKVVI
jgi:serine/threonine protein kinase